MYILVLEIGHFKVKLWVLKDSYIKIDQRLIKKLLIPE